MLNRNAGKRVLIITYYWPPTGGAGVQRWLKFTKYLRDYGWEPVIYTPSNPESPADDESLSKDIPEGIEILRTKIWEPYEYYKKLVGMRKGEKVNAGFLSEKKKPGFAERFSVWVRGNYFIPDARKFWIKPSVKFLTKYLNNNPVAALVTTGPPHSMHLIALGIRRNLHIPWLADFRDPWTGIDFYDQLHLTKKSDKKHRGLEKTVLAAADAVTLVSRQMQDEFTNIVNRKYSIVTNGFDESDIDIANLYKPDGKFSIVHVGSIAPARNPLILWKVLAQKVQSDVTFADSLEIKLIGKIDHSIIDSINNFGLTPYLTKIEYLPHDQIIPEMQKSKVLLLLINNAPNAKGILTGKLFEYLASKRPILCIGPEDGDAAKLLLETRAGKTAGFDNSLSANLILEDYFRSFLNYTLHTDPKGTEIYSRKELTGRIAGILDSISPQVRQ